MSTVESTTTQTLPAGTWNVDPVHSTVGFAVKYMVGTFRGSFSPIEATLSVAKDGGASLTGSAKAEGIKVQEPNLVTHLLSPDFFDAERAPELHFRSTDVRTAGEHVTRHRRPDDQGHHPARHPRGRRDRADHGSLRA